MNQKLQIFKKYSKDKKFYNLPTCHDPLTAKLIEKKGFKISFIGGFALSSSTIGYPDASLITLSELVNSTRIICNQTKLPVVVDADTGFGGMVNVYRTVKDLANAGASALIIEDQKFPKKCALTDHVKLLDLKESIKRFKTAIDASKEKNKKIINIFTRTDALPVEGLKETKLRIKKYINLRADGIFVTGIQSKKDLFELGKITKKVPLMLNITQNISFNMRDVKKSGFKFALFSQQILNSYIDSTNSTLDLIKNNKIPKFKNKASDTLSLLDFKKYLKIEKSK